jgi:hypothetical protein
VLDDCFISGFALAGTAEQVIAQAAQYRRAGADELALSFAGSQPAADAAYFSTGCQTPDTGWRTRDRRAPWPSRHLLEADERRSETLAELRDPVWR